MCDTDAMKLSELFTDETKWVKNMNCGIRGPDGVAHPRYGQDANCWCLLGGLNEIGGPPTATRTEEFSARVKQIRAAIKELFPERASEIGRAGMTYISVSDFNDNPLTTFADVQKVIAHVEAQ